MKTIIGCLLVVAFSVGAGSAGEDQKKELAKFAGTWALSELKYDGEDHSKLKLKITFKGNEGKVEGNERVTDQYGKMTFKIDPAAKPKTLDLTIAAGSQTDAKMLGIYEFKDGELHICAKVFGTDRPKEFAAPDGSSTVLLVLKREAK